MSRRCPRRLLLKKKKYAALVVNEDPRTGQVSLHKETKGLDMVRRDWCPLSKRTGARVLDFLLSGDQADVVVANVHKVLEDVGKEAREGRVTVADYVVTRGLNKPVEKYPDSKAQPHLRVAKAMLKEGRAVNVGDHIPYVICAYRCPIRVDGVRALLDSTSPAPPLSVTSMAYELCQTLRSRRRRRDARTTTRDAHAIDATRHDT